MAPGRGDEAGRSGRSSQPPAGLRPPLSSRAVDARASSRSGVEPAHGYTSEGAEADDDDDYDYDDDDKDSLSPSDLEPGFVYIDGDVGGSGYNETKVDIVAVPCPGADAVLPWIGDDPLPQGYFGFSAKDELKRHPTVSELAGDAILYPALSRHLPLAAHIWVRQGIRKIASTARVSLYKHRALSDDTTLSLLAEDLLEQVQKLREGTPASRPLFFIAHSIGGLVVKRALVDASRNEKYRPIVHNCHGVGFFGTPHRGSSFMSMSNLSESIQGLLHLERPLPRSLADEVRLGNQRLLRLHDEFVDVASELAVWTVYETIDSQLSGSGSSGSGFASEVEFGAPLVSIKSSLLEMRQERVFAVDSDHANCASFGAKNPKTMEIFLAELRAAVANAEKLSDTYVHHPLRLAEHVKVELVGFYEDPDADMDSAIRLYSAKYLLRDFLAKGPEHCLEERLNKAPPRAHPLPPPPPHSPFSPRRRGGGRKKGNGGADGAGGKGLGILSGMHKVFGSGRPRSRAQSPEPSSSSRGGSPDIVVTGPSRRPSITASRPGSAPSAVMRRLQSLTVPSLGVPDYRRSGEGGKNQKTGGASRSMSEPLREISPTSRADDGWESEPAVATTTTTMATAHAISTVDEESYSDPGTRPRPDLVETGSVLQDFSAGFSRPNPLLRRLMWIHVPFTNPLWVKDIIGKLAETHGQNLSRLFNNENWVSRHVLGRYSQSQSSFVKPGCSFVSADPTLSPQPTPSNSGRSTPLNSPSYFYLYLPYLHFDTYARMIRRRSVIRRRMSHGRGRPVPKDIADLTSLELRVVWQYLGFDPPLNCRRTLDQFGYPSMRDTYSRDDDQMLYKLTKKEPLGRPAVRTLPPNPRPDGAVAKNGANKNGPNKNGAVRGEGGGGEDSGAESDLDMADDVKEGNVLMVDQLWLWAIDTTTLATFFPKRESSPKEGTLFQQADLRNSIYHELNGDLTGRTENALDLAAFVALHAVTVLLDRTSHPDLEVFRIFEEAIGMLAEKMTVSLKQFRMQTFKEIAVGDSDTDDMEGNKPSVIKKRYRRELERAERENRENTSALLELRDMEDELATLSRLFDTQETTIRSMKAIYLREEVLTKTQNGRVYLDQALARLDAYKQQAADMSKRVETTRKDYEKLLGMAQRQAQVEDMRWSRIQTELASSQNLSVMIFTTFTVIFLPLSFFTSLFGMNTDEWRDDRVPTLGFIGAISLPLSFFLILASLVLAFSSRVQSWFRSLFRHARNLFRSIRDAVRWLEPDSSRQNKRRRKEEAELDKYRERKARDRGYDFWGAIERQRNSEYRIPDLNLQSPGARMPAGMAAGGWRP